ncbi:MAG: thiamine pyrophosphate-dependent enzyme [Pseudomonadota bacterium]
MTDRPVSLAEHLVAALAARGVKRIFGIPGGGSSLALIAAAERAGLDFVLARSETAAALMAAVTGELSGAPGVVLTGIGPGAASAVNGIAYAHLERAPVLLVTDGPAGSFHQAFDQNALYGPITKHQARLTPAGGRAQIEAALEFALTPPQGPVQLDLTADDAAAPADATPRLSAAPTPAAPDPAPALALLSESRRPLVIAGLETRLGDGPAALGRLVEALACPALVTYRAKGCLPDSHPGAVGLFTGAAGEAEVLATADLVVAVGLDPVEIIPGPWRAAAPLLELRLAATPPLPAPAAARLVGPLETSVAALLPGAARSQWQARDIAALRDKLGRRVALSGAGHTAESVVRALQAAAPVNCRLTVDSGAHMFSAMTQWRAEQPFDLLKSNGLSTMGFALPAALAAALHTPARPVAAAIGDGGLMMCLGELATAAEQGCRLVVVVLNDAALSLIDIKQQRQQHKAIGVRTGEIDFAAVATAMGCRAWRVGRGEDLAPAVAAAFEGDGPALIDVAVDPSGYGDQLISLRG